MANIIIIHDGIETEYETLSEALQNLENGCKCVLNADVELDQTIYIGGVAVTFDLNGHNIVPSHSKDAVVVYSAGHFILQDTSETGSGTFYSSSSCIDLGAGNDYAGPNSFTMYSGNIIAQEFGVAIFGGGVVNIHGGSIKGKDNAAIGANGSKKYADYPYEINITGGNIIAETQTAGYANCGLYAANAGTVNVSGGFINGVDGAGIVIRGGDVNISGGTVQGSGSTEGLRMGDANPTFCGGVEVCNAANYPGKIGTCTISGGNVVSKSNSAALVIGDPHDPSYPNSENSEIIITGGVFESQKDAIGFITKSGEDIEEAGSANLTVMGGSFSSDVTSYLAEGVELEKIILPDGTIGYAVAKTLSDVVESIDSVKVDIDNVNQNVLDSISAINNSSDIISDVKDSVNTANSKLDSIYSDLENLKEDSNVIKTSVDSIQTGVADTNAALVQIDQDIQPINENISQVNQNLESLDTKLDGVSTTATNIKSDTSAIKSTSNVISNSVDAVSDSLENLINVDKKILEQVAKINGDDPSDVDPETPKDLKAIELIQIKANINACKLSGQQAFIWNHKMNETAKEYCESKNYTIIQPEYLGGQYLICISE